MKATELRINEVYLAKVSGRIVPVRLDRIQLRIHHSSGRAYREYHVTNLRTGRKLTFRSPQRFRRSAV